MIHHYGTKSPELTLELSDKKIVKFVNHEFVTENDDTAKKIESTNKFKNGSIYHFEGAIAGANRPQIVTGSRGTDNNDLVSQLQKRLEKLEADNVELRKPKKVGRPKKEPEVVA